MLLFLSGGISLLGDRLVLSADLSSNMNLPVAFLEERSPLFFMIIGWLSMSRAIYSSSFLRMVPVLIAPVLVVWSARLSLVWVL